MTLYGKTILCRECKGVSVDSTPPIQTTPKLVGSRIRSRQSSVLNCVDCKHIWHQSWINDDEVDRIIGVEQRNLQCI